MKKKVTAILIGLGMLLVAGTAFSQISYHWSGDIKITKIMPSTNWLVFYTEDFPNKSWLTSACDRFKIDSNYLDSKTQSAALIAAFLAKKTINIEVVYDQSLFEPYCDTPIRRFQVMN